jgi:hypothetical protein
MTRFKDFGSGISRESEPLSFKLHEEEFHCVPELQGQVLLELVSNSDSDDPVKSALLMTDFFKSALLDESYERFENLLKDKERIVTVDTIAEVVSWLMESYTNRPNPQPED